MRYAAIDVGTNTILMVIGENDGNEIKILRDEHSIARLGQGVDESGNIAPEAIERALVILSNYNDICKSLNVEKIWICGTSALRDASNRDKVISSFLNVIDAEIKIISGENEAALSYLGAMESEISGDALVIDIGGGSTEFITGANGEFNSKISLQIGSVRLNERILKSSPPSGENIEKTIDEIIRHLNKIDINNFKYNELYAVAGTPTTIAAIAQDIKDFQPEKIHGYKLTLAEVNKVFEILSVLPKEEITEIYGVHPKRADVILAGVIILKESLKYLAANSCIVSTRGLRYGILYEMF